MYERVEIVEVGNPMAMMMAQMSGKASLIVGETAGKFLHQVPEYSALAIGFINEVRRLGKPGDRITQELADEAGYQELRVEVIDLLKTNPAFEELDPTFIETLEASTDYEVFANAMETLPSWGDEHKVWLG